MMSSEPNISQPSQEAGEASMRSWKPFSSRGFRPETPGAAAMALRMTAKSTFRAEFAPTTSTA